MEHGQLATWEGMMHPEGLDQLIERVNAATLIGQRPGDFTLGLSLPGGAGAWSTGRCFNEDIELRWWQAEDGGDRRVFVLNRLPDGWTAPVGWKRRLHALAGPPDYNARYLCVGRYDGSVAGAHLWWESRYSRAFAYLASAPPAPDERHGRVYLRAVMYDLEEGYTQHRLVRFEHAGPESAA